MKITWYNMAGPSNCAVSPGQNASLWFAVTVARVANQLSVTHQILLKP